MENAKIRTVNLETGLPHTEDALRYLEDSVRKAKRDRIPYLLVIHGYGSSGRGGAICREARLRLADWKRNGSVRDFIPGDEFTLFNFNALRMKNNCPDLAPLLRACNRGVTVIEV